MCFYYEGTCEVYRESIHVARKTHKCCSCRKDISVGEQYLSVFTVFEGESDTRSVCNLCTQDAVMIHRHELRAGCEGAESWCYWEEVHSTMRRGGEERHEELDTDWENDFCVPVLFWIYGVPPAASHVDLKSLPELQPNLDRKRRERDKALRLVADLHLSF